MFSFLKKITNFFRSSQSQPQEKGNSKNTSNTHQGFEDPPNDIPHTKKQGKNPQMLEEELYDEPIHYTQTKEEREKDLEEYNSWKKESGVTSSKKGKSEQLNNSNTIVSNIEANAQEKSIYANEGDEEITYLTVNRTQTKEWPNSNKIVTDEKVEYEEMVCDKPKINQKILHSFSGDLMHELRNKLNHNNVKGDLQNNGNSNPPVSTIYHSQNSGASRQ